MRQTSLTWPQLVTAFRQGVGVEVWLAIHVPSRNLVLTSRAWPDGWLPDGALVYPFLGPTGQGVNTFSIELADDRSSRLGTVSCQVLVTAGQVGSPPDPRLTVLTSLAEQEALVYGLLRGGVSQTTYERCTLFAGRVSAMTLARGVLSFTLVDGVAAEHRDLEIPLGSSVFPGSPTAAHGQAVPLIFGTALGLEPVLVAGDAQGTLATPLDATPVTTIDLVETAAAFPDSGTLTIDAETLTYSGRRLGVLLQGQAALQLLEPVRSTPVAHAAGVSVTLADVTYRYLLGTGVPGLEVLAVRDDAGPVLAYTLVTDPPGTPAGTVVLETMSAHTALQVDVQAIPVPPLPPLLNGGFESGALDGWTVEAGTTATVVAQEVLDGHYKLQLGPIPVGTTQGVWQDIAVEPGKRYVVHLAWRTPLETSANVVPNGAFTQPTLAPWVFAQTQGPPIPVTYLQGTGGERGQVQLILPPGPPIPPTGPIMPSAIQFHVTLTQASVVVVAGVRHTLAVEVWAFAQPPWWIPGGFAGSLSGTYPRVDMFVRVSDTGTGAAQAFLQLQGGALTAPALSPGQWLRYLAQGQITPEGATVTITLTISGYYWGTLPPISVRAILLSATPDADDTATLQATGLVELGLPSAPEHYARLQSSGSPNWEALDVGFVAEQALLRLTLRGQAGTADARVEYDSVRFLAPGRNPVTLMAAVFARFLPHLTLNQASVQAAEARRQSWLFGGYLPDPGRTDALLVKMAQESWCTVYKDLDGVYQITADDSDVQSVLSLQADRDVVRESLALTWLPMDQVYTDFYLWYGRVTQATTTVPAGQYAAVLYVTPDASISTNPDLQPLCQQVAMSLRTRKRFDYYADLISDPPTADRLLTRLVQQLAVLPEELTLTTSVPGLPLALTDRVQVRGGLLGPRPWVGDVRQTTLTVAPGPPGLAVTMRLRRAGLRRGAWEEWEYAALPPTLRVLEWWDEGNGNGNGQHGPWYFQSDFADQTPTVGNLYALRGLDLEAGLGGIHQIAAAGGGPLDAAAALSTQSPAWRFTDAQVPTMRWASAFITTPFGRGTALGLVGATGPEPQLYVGFERTSGTAEIWSLVCSAGNVEAQVATLPDGKQVWAMAEYDFLDGRGNGLYIGATSGATFGPTTPMLYRWNLVDTLTVVFDEGVINRRVRALAVDPETGAFWAAQDNDPFSGTGAVVMYHLTPLGYNSTVPGGLGGGNRQTCNMAVFGGTLWAAFGVQDRSEIRLWSITHGIGLVGRWDLRYTVTGLTDQLPGCLAAFDGRLWLGCLSTTGAGTPEVWRSDTSGLGWERDSDFAEAADGDPNTSVTAMATARGRLYAATGVPYGGPAPGARVYCYPTAESASTNGASTNGPWLLQSAFAPPGNYCYGLLGAETAQLDLTVGYQPGSFWSNHTQAPVALFRNANVASGLWDAGLVLAGGGMGSALGVYNTQVYVTVRPVASPQQWQLWRLDPTASGTGDASMVTLLPPFISDIQPIRDMREFAGLGDGNWLYIGGQAANEISRWNGTTLEPVPFDFGSAGAIVRSFFVMQDQVTHVADLYAVEEGGPGASGTLLRLVRDPDPHFVVAKALSGRYPSPVVPFAGAPMLAMGSGGGDYILIQRLTCSAGDIVETTVFLFTDLPGHRPGALAVYNDRLYLGRLSTSATAMLELWRSNVDATAWSLEVDFAPILAGDSTADTNTGISALASARGKFYAATSTLIAGPAPGIRVYCHPIAEGLV